MLYNWSEKWLLEVNLKKTKIMIMQKQKAQPKNMQFHIGKYKISITHEYTYLGLKLTSNTKLDAASQQLSKKAMHAMYKIRKQIDFHQLPPKLACKLRGLGSIQCRRLCEVEQNMGRKSPPKIL